MTTARPPILSTVGDPQEPAWRGLMEASHPRPGRPLLSLLELWARSYRREALVLRGSVTARDLYRDLVFALALRHRRRRPRTLVTDATWEPGSRTLAARLPWLQPHLPQIARLMIRALDGPHVHYAVLSQEERAVFARTWGVPVERVVFTPFPMTLYAEYDRQTHDGGYLFAGGNSLRDYDLLAAALAGSGYEAHVASRWTPPTPVPGLHARPTSHDEFTELLLGCRAMVLPLERSSRSAGQQTFLNAMVLGKPVIVTDAMGVRDYVEDGVTGVVVPPDPTRLREALDHVMDPANAEHYRRMGARARAEVLGRRMPEHYVQHLVAALGYGPAPQPAEPAEPAEPPT